MSADLIATNGQSINLNWTGHSDLLDVLYQLGADIEPFPRTNDGEAVDSWTALCWGDLILDNLDRIGVIETTEVVARLHADGSFTEEPRKEFLVVDRGEQAWLPDEQRAWLVHRAEFLRTSGGFRQY